MSLHESFWDTPQVLCGQCYAKSHPEEDMPLACDCGHVLKSENMHEVGFERILTGNMNYKAMKEIHAIEDARVFAALDKVASDASA